MNGAPGIPLKWIFWLSATVILAATFSAIAVLFVLPNPTHTQHMISVALLCFALTSIAGLLFAAKVELTGTIGVISMSLVGPAFAWLAGC